VFIVWKHALENQIELRGTYTGPTDAPDVHALGTQGAERIPIVEQTLERAWPARRLVERIAFDGAPARNQDSIETAVVTRVISALAVCVDLDSNARLYFRKDLAVLTYFETHTRWPDTIPRTMAYPPTSHRLGRNKEPGSSKRADQYPEDHV
jgi:hypothetical protein